MYEIRNGAGRLLGKANKSKKTLEINNKGYVTFIKWNQDNVIEIVNINPDGSIEIIDV